MIRKRPTGKEWEKFVAAWAEASHDQKLELAKLYGTTYGTAKHWISDEGAAVKDSGTKATTITGEPTPSTIPLQLDTGSEDTLVAVINDLHVPFHDPVILEAVEKFLVEVQPDHLFYNGDIIDFYQISDYEKDPARMPLMQKEITMVSDMLDKHRVMLSGTTQWYITGTHERRLQRFLWTKTPALSSLKCLTLDSLFGLTAKGIIPVDYEQGVIVNGVFLILHGDVTSIYSGYTAKRLMDKHGGCGIAGHCHRAGSYYKRDRFGTWGWWENGCLCSLNPDWIQNPNWTQGFSLIHFRKSRFWVEQIPIIDGTFLYGGKMYGRKGS